MGLAKPKPTTTKAPPKAVGGGATKKPTFAKGNTKEFCAAARRFLDLPQTLPDTIDQAWLDTVTEPTWSMARYAPASLARSSVQLALSAYLYRASAVQAITGLEAGDPVKFGRSIGLVIDQLESSPDRIGGPGSLRYEGALQLVSAGVKKQCRIDMQAEINRKLDAIKAEAGATQ